MSSTISEKCSEQCLHLILRDEAGYLNTHVPFLPPMIEGRGVFVHFAPATLVADHIHHTGDGLSPWTFQGARTIFALFCLLFVPKKAVFF